MVRRGRESRAHKRHNKGGVFKADSRCTTSKASSKQFTGCVACPCPALVVAFGQRRWVDNLIELTVDELNELQYVAPIKVALIVCGALKPFEQAPNIDRPQADKLIGARSKGFRIVLDLFSQFLCEGG